MKIKYVSLFTLVAALLSSCATPTPEASPLILTQEDLRLKRVPYDPCPGEGVRVCVCK